MERDELIVTLRRRGRTQAQIAPRARGGLRTPTAIQHQMLTRKFWECCCRDTAKIDKRVAIV